MEFADHVAFIEGLLVADELANALNFKKGLQAMHVADDRLPSMQFPAEDSPFPQGF